jgi:hypothetical protein
VSVYTPPALNAVDFALTAFTPADVTPYGIALSTYTPPAINAVDFALSAYTPPTFPYVGWELLPSNNITGTASYGQGAGAFDAVASLNFTGTAEIGQGAGTFDGVAALNFAGAAEFWQASGTFNALATTEQAPSGIAPKAGGGSYAHVVPEDYKRKRREMNMRLLILLAASDY